MRVATRVVRARVSSLVDASHRQPRHSHPRLRRLQHTTAVSRTSNDAQFVVSSPLLSYVEYTEMTQRLKDQRPAAQPQPRPKPAAVLRPPRAQSAPSQPSERPPPRPLAAMHGLDRYTLNGKSPFHVLGVETTCDDTAMAILDSDGRILSQYRASQWDLHRQYGGIHPRMASLQHQSSMNTVYQRVLQASGLSESAIDAISVASGPGLALCLNIGVTWSKALANQLRIPIIGVNHLRAHALITQLTHSHLQYPYLTLLISGGHTELWLVKSLSETVILGQTMDSAIGDAIDKAVRMLAIDYDNVAPGRALEQFLATHMQAFPQYRDGSDSVPQALSGLPRLPIPLFTTNDCDFSFCGLRSALQRAVDHCHAVNSNGATGTVPTLTLDQQYYLANQFLVNCVKHLKQRVNRALKWSKKFVPQCRQLVVSGGVASNTLVRDSLVSLCRQHGVEMLTPPISHCTDNGIMIAWQGITQLAMGERSDSQLDFVSQWPVGDTVRVRTKNRRVVADRQ